jgi:hypothetical protein
MHVALSGKSRNGTRERRTVIEPVVLHKGEIRPERRQRQSNHFREIRNRCGAETATHFREKIFIAEVCSSRLAGRAQGSACS